MPPFAKKTTPEYLTALLQIGNATVPDWDAAHELFETLKAAGYRTDPDDLQVDQLMNGRYLIHAVRPLRRLPAYAARDARVKAYDTALPQSWVDHVRDKFALQVVGHFAWAYFEDDTFGMPIPVTPEGVRMAGTILRLS